MEIIEWEQFMAEGLPIDSKPSAMTVGVFDGVHLGHQALIKEIVSRNETLTPVVVTFRQNYKTDKALQHSNFSAKSGNAEKPWRGNTGCH